MPNTIVDEAKHIFSGEPNMSTTERALSVVGGLALAAAAAKPRPNMLLNLVALIAGSALAVRGATGHCPVKALMGSEDNARLAKGGGSVVGNG